MDSRNETALAPLKTWLAMPMEAEAHRTIERIRRAEDVVHVAVMTDVHVGTDVCVVTAMSTRRLLFPSVVGGDIGCGMLAVAFECPAEVLRNPQHAGALLRLLGERIPSQRRHRAKALSLPADLAAGDLSHPSLSAAIKDEGRLQLGTLGGGNHFIELQADEEDRLWLMIH